MAQEQEALVRTPDGRLIPVSEALAEVGAPQQPSPQQILAPGSVLAPEGSAEDIGNFLQLAGQVGLAMALPESVAFQSGGGGILNLIKQALFDEDFDFDETIAEMGIGGVGGLVSKLFGSGGRGLQSIGAATKQSMIRGGQGILDDAARLYGVRPDQAQELLGVVLARRGINPTADTIEEVSSNMARLQSEYDDILREVGEVISPLEVSRSARSSVLGSDELEQFAPASSELNQVTREFRRNPKFSDEVLSQRTVPPPPRRRRAGMGTAGSAASRRARNPPPPPPQTRTIRGREFKEGVDPSVISDTNRATERVERLVPGEQQTPRQQFQKAFVDAGDEAVESAAPGATAARTNFLKEENIFNALTGAAGASERGAVLNIPTFAGAQTAAQTGNPGMLGVALLNNPRIASRVGQGLFDTGGAVASVVNDVPALPAVTRLGLEQSEDRVEPFAERIRSLLSDFVDISSSGLPGNTSARRRQIPQP